VGIVFGMSHCSAVSVEEDKPLVLGRVSDSYESDSSLFAFLVGEREDPSKMSRTRVRVF
jgi:hypothetical protein